MQDKSIDKLLLRISQGDDAAFEELYSLTGRGVFAFIYAYLKNYQDSEDVMQSVYLKIKLNADKYVQGTNARAWILQISKNLCLNEIKKRKTSVELTDDVPSPQCPSSRVPITDVINRVLDEEERNIVILHVLWGYKHREIAQMINCPIGTVTSKYKRAAEKIKKTLKEESL